MHDGGTDKIVRFFQNFYLQRFGDYFARHRGMSKDLENAIGPRLAVLEESPMSIPNVSTTLNLDNLESRQPRISTTPNLDDPEFQRPQISTTPYFDDPESRQPRISTTPNLDDPESR